MAREPNREDAPYRPWGPWHPDHPDYGKPTDKPKLTKNTKNIDAFRSKTTKPGGSVNDNTA